MSKDDKESMGDVERHALLAVIEALKPLSDGKKERILSSVALFFGVSVNTEPSE